MTVQQLGSYVFDAGVALGMVFHTPEMASVSQFLETTGLGMESGQASFSVKVADAVQIGTDLVGAGFILQYFSFTKPAAPFCSKLGADLASGKGAFGPVRVGDYGVSGSVSGDTVTFTVAAWQ